MILLFSGLYVLLCILAFLVWHDFIAAPDEKSLTGRIVVKRKEFRVLARMSMLLFGPPVVLSAHTGSCAYSNNPYYCNNFPKAY